MYRVGLGYDVHPLEEGIPLILGGVNIKHPLGLRGHSDADVICHSITDALLGAANIGDIGEQFPDTDERYKGISSLELLSESILLLKENGWEVENVDVSVVAEEPKINPYKKEMRDNISNAMNCNVNSVSIKATTNEKLGTIGRGEGIAVFSVALLKETKNK